MTGQDFPRSGIDDALQLAVETGALPGIVAMAADRHRVRYEGAAGLRAVDGAQPMTLDTTFRIHSMTKAITAAAAMQLVERGQLSLDAPLAPLLPDLGALQVLEGFDAEGSPQLRPAQTPVTLRMLLTHTAGFSYDLWNAQTLRYQKATGFPGPFTGTLRSLLQPLSFEPGSRWQYSIAIDWVGRAIEAASGLDLEAYFRQNIFSPLGMTDTTFVQTDEQRSRRVTMHRRQPDGGIATFVLDRPETTEFYGGGGGLFGTVPDYIRFAQAFLNEGGPILKPETVSLMAQNHIGDLDVEPMISALPSSETCEFWPGMTKKWGLSFLINTERTPQGRSPGSLAWAGLSNLYFWIDRTRGVTGVFAAQMLPFFDARAVAAFEAFESEVYKALGADKA